MELKGMHHLTAVTAQAAENVAFYTRTLGMRLVKKTVNQDDTSAYHLFYGDGEATPGSDLTFFDFPAPRESRGTHSIVRTALRVTGADALAWWHERLNDLGVACEEPAERDGRLTLDFDDPEGQRLALIDDGSEGEGVPWENSPVPSAYQIRGLGPATMSVPDLAPTEQVVTEVMGMEQVRDYPAPGSPGCRVHVFRMGAGGAHAELHVAVEPHLPPTRPGAGGVHHVAFRIEDDAYDQWAERLRHTRLPRSGPVDRYYFRSLYFREPNGVLFEIATEGPGFTVDEPLESLGESLSLPPFLEDRRAAIEAGIKPL